MISLLRRRRPICYVLRLREPSKHPITSAPRCGALHKARATWRPGGHRATAACNGVLAYIGSDAWRDAGFEDVFWYRCLKETIFLTINDVGGPLGRWMILLESLRLRGVGNGRVCTSEDTKLGKLCFSSVVTVMDISTLMNTISGSDFGSPVFRYYASIRIDQDRP